MTLNQAKLIDAKASKFEYVQVNVNLSAMNDDAFAMAA
jgi:hypothetical protein